MSRNALAALLTVALVLGVAAAPATARISSPPQAVAGTVVRDDGLVAEYFAADPAKASRGAVVVLGGSEGGLQGSRPIARRLAAEGLDAIAVSYFGEPGQSRTLNLIPIEPVSRAAAWLHARRDGAEPIAVVGVSKGAELALVAASRDSRLTAVVVGAPSHLIWQGIDMTGAPTDSSWTVGGRPLPFASYDLSHGFSSIFRLYEGGVAAAPAQAHIPVERINGPVMLISSRDDALWPATPMAERIRARLAAHGFAHRVEVLTYDAAGHAVFGGPLANAPSAQTLAFLGGTPEGLQAARADGWPRVVTFLKTALAD